MAGWINLATTFPRHPKALAVPLITASRVTDHAGGHRWDAEAAMLAALTRRVGVPPRRRVHPQALTAGRLRPGPSANPRAGGPP